MPCQHWNVNHEEERCADCELSYAAIEKGLTWETADCTPRVIDGRKVLPLHHWITSGGERLCCACGLMRGTVQVNEYRANRIIRRHDTYQPTEYLEKKYMQLAGLTNVSIPDRGLDRLFVGYLGCRTWYDVHTLVTKAGIAEHFLRVPALLGEPLFTAGWAHTVMRIVYDDLFDFRLKFTYIVAKMVQIFQPTPVATKRSPVPVAAWRWVPLKVKKTTHMSNEKKWKIVCEEFGLPYIRIPFDQLLTPWTRSDEE